MFGSLTVGEMEFLGVGFGAGVGIGVGVGIGGYLFGLDIHDFQV